MASEELMDPSLGSLPTLIVPDDPLTGAIEKPKTPPPSARPSESKPSPRPPPEGKAPTPKVTPRPEHGDQQQQPTSPPEEQLTSSPVAIYNDGQSQSVMPPSSPAAVAPAPATGTTPPMAAPQGNGAPAISSRDFKAMSKQAVGLARLDRLAGGNKSVFDANMEDIGALGIGMQLYFMLTKYLSIIFLIMGVLSMPAIIVHLSGNGVTESQVDPLKLAYASLGNEGVHPEIETDQDLCLPKGYIDCTWTTVETPFTTDPMTVSWIITLSDVVYSAAFLFFYLIYRYRAKRAIDIYMNENLTPAKYAVFVRGLPTNATEQEIVEHFSTRYDLTKEEEYNPLWFGCCWGRRRKVKNSLSRNAVNRNTVQNLDHLAGTTSITKELYLNTWIAEVSIGHPTGGLLKTFLSMEALTRNISETQQLIAILEAEKKQSEAMGNPKKGKHAFRPGDERLLQTAVTKLAKLEAQLEKKTGKIKALKRGPTSAPPTPTGANSSDPKATAKNAIKKAQKAAAATSHAFNWEACECAFVVFNNLESRRRCLQDYRKSTSWLARKFQPKILRFRNGQFPLIVRPAPEPSNILWENLEVTDRGRFYRRSFTNIVTLLLLLFSCAIISGAQSAQSEMKKKLVTPGFCDWTLPTVFYGNTSFATKHRIDWNLVWNPNTTCTAGPGGEPRYHIAYDNGIINDLYINRTVPILAGKTAPVRCVDTCISELSNKTCSSMACFDQDLVDGGEKCETYPEANVLFCLCKEAVTNSITEYGIFEGPQRLWEQYVPCRGFIKDYLIRNVFMYVAAGIVVIVNLLLKSILRAFATFEAHSSESAKASAIAVKMFGAQFLNTAIIVLVVNAALNLQGLPLLGDLFKGKYKDFERDWYPSVGMGITMTMLINAFVPQVILFLQMFIIGPLTRCIKRRSIRTQEQMNSLYAGPAFDISVRYPMVLNSVFVTMVFCGGSPVLLFIASLTAAGTFWFDKLSIIHLYSVKTAYDEELGETALNILPWTLVLHLAFSTWMYGNMDLMKSKTIDLNTLFNLLHIEVVDANGTTIDPANLYEEFYNKASSIKIIGKAVVRIVHSNVLVVFLFFVVVILGLVLSTVFTQILWPILSRTLGIIVRAMWKRCKDKFHQRQKRRRQQTASAKVHVDNNPPAPPVSTPSTESSPADAPTSGGDVSAMAPVPNADGTAAVDGSNVSVPLITKSQDAPVPQPSTTPSSQPLSPRPVKLVIPEYTDIFRKTVPRKFKPDKRLGFEKDADGGLIRLWKEETTKNGIKRLAGEQMRTWEAMQAPVKSYAIEMNSKYRLAVAEIVAAAKRLRLASDAKLAEPQLGTEASPIPDSAEKPATAPAVPADAVDAAIAATEPVSIPQIAEGNMGPPEATASTPGTGAESVRSGNDSSVLQVSIQG